MQLAARHRCLGSEPCISIARMCCWARTGMFAGARVCHVAAARTWTTCDGSVVGVCGYGWNSLLVECGLPAAWVLRSPAQRGTCSPNVCQQPWKPNLEFGARVGVLR